MGLKRRNGDDEGVVSTVAGSKTVIIVSRKVKEPKVRGSRWSETEGKAACALLGARKGEGVETKAGPEGSRHESDTGGALVQAGHT